MQDHLPHRQAAVFATVSDWWETTGEPCSSSRVAAKLLIAKQVIARHFEALYRKGWLRSPGSPAIPARRMPKSHDGVPDLHLAATDAPCDVEGMAKASADQPGLPFDGPRTIELLPLSLRAEVAAQSVDDEQRTVELIFSTGSAVERYDWMSDKRYLEMLSLEPSAVRLDRLNAGGPLLDGHSAWSVSDILGGVVPGSVSLAKKQARATVRFSRREAVEPVWQDVKDGIVRSVSVGYRVYKYEETAPGKDNAMAIRTAVDWEPFEVSMVPIPADAGAHVRSKSTPALQTNPCQILTRAEAVEAPPEEQPKEQKETKAMKPNEQSETIAEPRETRTAPVVQTDPPEPNERDAGAAQERARVLGIRNACLAARLPRSFEDKLIADGLSLVDAQARVFEEMRLRSDPRPDVPGPGARREESVIVGDDPLVHKRSGIVKALLHRANPIKFELDDEARQYRGLGLMDVADIFLRARGDRITGMSKTERAGAALTTRVGMHTISDFPSLLADVSNKLLRAAYEEAPQTWRPLARPVPVSDFKSRKMLQVGDAPQLEEVLEHGEFKSGTITEAKEEVQLKTYGKMFTITRQALINDDTNAFAEVPSSFGRAARSKEADLAWAQITSNPVMGDGAVLFILATHRNLASASAVISVTSIGVGRTALRTMKGIDGVTPLNLSPNYLIVPAAIETVADQFVSNALMAAEPGKVNPFAGRLQVISEPRLDDASATAWYLATNATQCPVLFYATLDGQEGPTVDQELGFDVDGLKIKCRLDVAFKAADWHGIFCNAGA